MFDLLQAQAWLLKAMDQLQQFHEASCGIARGSQPDWQSVASFVGLTQEACRHCQEVPTGCGTEDLLMLARCAGK